MEAIYLLRHVGEPYVTSRSITVTLRHTNTYRCIQHDSHSIRNAHLSASLTSDVRLYPHLLLQPQSMWDL